MSTNNNIGYMKALESTVHFYKRIYFVNLDENYCKLIYPETLGTDEGNYREKIIVHIYNEVCIFGYLKYTGDSGKWIRTEKIA